MKLKKTIIAADLFCGAGGSSTGLLEAVGQLGFDLDLVAVNHWDIAIATHTENHSHARHLCQSIDTIQPESLFPGKRLHLLLASPECTDHSNAKGGKPRSDQKRADAWLLMRWIEKLYVENIIIENVKEFVNWGPLNAKGLPDRRHRGKYFRQFVEALKINYSVEWRILNCADYGDATTRERFFLIAKRNGKPIKFPEPTHAHKDVIEKESKAPGLFVDKSKLQTWRPAREIVDWSLKGQSIFNRKKPLSENTMRRIFAGLFKYSLKPFIMGTGGPVGQQNPRSVDEPVRTVMPNNRQNIFVPYVLNYKSQARQMRSTDEPLFTQTTRTHQYIAEPFIVNLKGKERRMRSVEEPAFSQTTSNHQTLIEPFLVNLSHTKNAGGAMCLDADSPLKTICGKAMLGLIEPFLVKFYGGQDSTSLDQPIPTITANYEHYALAEPFIVPCNHGAGDERFHSIDDPMKTITQVDAWGFVEPFLVKFNNNQGAQDIDEPLGTLTTKDRYGLCIPQIGAVIDILFRMLQPHELGEAMGFPRSYVFLGTRDQKVKQIGNAVPVNTAKALCLSVLRGE